MGRMIGSRWLALGIGVALAAFWVSVGFAAFVDNGETVSDTVTGLMWQKGDSQNDAWGRSWEQALNYCECLTLPTGGYSDWRLPNVRGLETLVNWNRYDLAINQLFSCRPDSYWSSSTNAGRTDYAWSVLFNYGSVGSSDKTNLYYVRCVRGGPSGSFDYSIIATAETGGTISPSGTVGVNAGDSVKFTIVFQKNNFRY